MFDGHVGAAVEVDAVVAVFVELDVADGAVGGVGHFDAVGAVAAVADAGVVVGGDEFGEVALGEAIEAAGGEAVAVVVVEVEVDEGVVAAALGLGGGVAGDGAACAVAELHVADDVVVDGEVEEDGAAGGGVEVGDVDGFAVGPVGAVEDGVFAGLAFDDDGVVLGAVGGEGGGGQPERAVLIVVFMVHAAAYADDVTGPDDRSGTLEGREGLVLRAPRVLVRTLGTTYQIVPSNGPTLIWTSWSA